MILYLKYILETNKTKQKKNENANLVDYFYVLETADSVFAKQLDDVDILEAESSQPITIESGSR